MLNIKCYLYLFYYISGETAINYNSCVEGSSPLTLQTVHRLLPVSESNHHAENDQVCCSKEGTSIHNGQPFMTNKILNNDLYLSGSEGDDTDKNGNYIPEEQSSDRDSQDSRTSFRRNVVNKSQIARKCQKHECKPEQWICNKQKQVMQEDNNIKQEGQEDSGKSSEASMYM
jgi:hypothetical protein